MWWANQGKQRALAQRAAATHGRRWNVGGKRSVSPILCGVLVWGFIWFVGVFAYMAFALRRSRAPDESISSTSTTPNQNTFPTLTQCAVEFDGPISGNLLGCSRGCVRFQTIQRAQIACAELSDCGGVVAIAIAPGTSAYELRASATLVPPTNSEINRGVSNLAYIKRCATDAQHKDDQLLHGGEVLGTETHMSRVDKIKRNTIAEPNNVADVRRANGWESNDNHAENVGRDFETDEGDSNDDNEPAQMNDQREIENINGRVQDGATAAVGHGHIRRVSNGNNDVDDDNDNGNIAETTSDTHKNDVDSSSSKNNDGVQFWEPPVGLTDLDSIGTLGADGEPTVFIGIASYRDMMCHETIERALYYAKRPDNIFFGVVEQNAEGDTPCLYTKQTCEEAPEQLLCKHRDQVRVMKVDARSAMGPTWGRHRADSLYQGEYFALQIDAHMYFVLDWDEDAIQQFRKTGNDHAVLTNYPSDVPGSLDKHGRSRLKSTPTVCSSTFVGGEKMTKHDSAQEFYPRSEMKGSPVLQVWWAAGVSFSRGHRIVRVPYDCCLPMIFDGEETSMAFRMWTHGYDFYTFHHSIVFHPYSRKVRPPLFWENGDRHPGAADRAAKRLQHIYGLTPAPESESFDHTELERYGLGNRPDRPLGRFFEIFGVDFNNQKVRNNCLATMNGDLHFALASMMTPGGAQGINYDCVPINVADNNFSKAGGAARRETGLYSAVINPCGVVEEKEQDTADGTFGFQSQVEIDSVDEGVQVNRRSNGNTGTIKKRSAYAADVVPRLGVGRGLPKSKRKGKYSKLRREAKGLDRQRSVVDN